MPVLLHTMIQKYKKSFIPLQLYSYGLRGNINVLGFTSKHRRGLRAPKTKMTSEEPDSQASPSSYDTEYFGFESLQVIYTNKRGGIKHPERM